MAQAGEGPQIEKWSAACLKPQRVQNKERLKIGAFHPPASVLRVETTRAPAKLTPCEEQEEMEEQAAAMLPPDATPDKIPPYETALERQLYRAMNQLERLQPCVRAKIFQRP